MTYADLIKRLEYADGPDRELDAEIEYVMQKDFLDTCYKIKDSTRELGWKWIGPYGPIAAPDIYTASLDAAISLLNEKLPDAHWGVATDKVVSKGWIAGPVVSAPIERTHKSEPLALIAATLKAKIAELEE